MFFHSRSHSREFLGMIASDSHSRIVGMDFFHSLPFPELWEWIFFIPFPSRICHFTNGNHNGNWNIVRDIRFLIISLSSIFLATVHIGGGKLSKGASERLKSFVANSYAAKMSVIVIKIIMLLIVAVTMTRRGGIIKKGGCGYGQNSFSRQYF